MVKICEIFRSLQGELQGLGRHCLFIRTYGCNLGENCPLDCDTPYSWSENGENAWKEYSVDELKAEIETSGTENVVITGGEPLLWQEVIARLFSLFKGGDIDWFIETNGTIKPQGDISRNEHIFFNVSPKQLPFDPSGFPLDRTIFKIVVDPREDDLRELKSKLSSINGPVAGKIFLMPASRNKKEYMANAELLGNWCGEHAFNFGPRLHLLLWRGKRGK